MGGGNGIMENLINEEKEFYSSLSSAMYALVPGALYNLQGNDYNSIEWNEDNTLDKPTEQETIDKRAELAAEWDSLHKEVGIKRKGEYPPLEDFADAMYWNSKGDDSKLTEYYAACEAVKIKYPKV